MNLLWRTVHSRVHDSSMAQRCSSYCGSQTSNRTTLKISCQTNPPMKPMKPMKSPGRPNKLPKMPSRGFFSDADPNATVYAKGGKTFDPAKKIKRWEPEFIWQTPWQEALRLQEVAEKAKTLREEERLASIEDGALNLARVTEVSSLDADLTGVLSNEQKTSTSDAAFPSISEISSRKRGSSMNPPSVAETKRWERGGKFSQKVVALAPTNSVDADARAAEALAEKLQYDQLKSEFQLWTFAIALGGSAATYLLYNQDISISFMVGSLGGMLYLRLLNRSVDGVGSASLASALGQQRLLIPVILTLFFNRWNLLYAPSVGVHMQLIPMLLGFFTYKAGVLGRQSLQLMLDLTDNNSSEEQANVNSALDGQAAPQDGEASQKADKQAQQAAVDKAYTKRILSG